MNDLIILDRDGVINFEAADYIKSPEEWTPIPGSLEAIAQLNRACYTVALATNQGGIARGLYTHKILQAIHQKMQDALQQVAAKIDAIFYCPHIDEQNCDCRKPKPGLLRQIAQHYGCSLSGVRFIGDSWRDIQAAYAIGCQPILVLTGYGKETLRTQPELKNQIPCFSDLAAAVSFILSA